MSTIYKVYRKDGTAFGHVVHLKTMPDRFEHILTTTPRMCLAKGCFVETTGRKSTKCKKHERALATANKTVKDLTYGS